MTCQRRSQQACYRDTSQVYIKFRGTAVLGSGTFGGPTGVAGASNLAGCSSYADAVGFNFIGALPSIHCICNTRRTIFHLVACHPHRPPSKFHSPALREPPP